MFCTFSSYRKIFGRPFLLAILSIYSLTWGIFGLNLYLAYEYVYLRDYLEEYTLQSIYSWYSEYSFFELIEIFLYISSITVGVLLFKYKKSSFIAQIVFIALMITSIVSMLFVILDSEDVEIRYYLIHAFQLFLNLLFQLIVLLQLRHFVKTGTLK